MTVESPVSPYYHCHSRRNIVVMEQKRGKLPPPRPVDPQPGTSGVSGGKKRTAPSSPDDQPRFPGASDEELALLRKETNDVAKNFTKESLVSFGKTYSHIGGDGTQEAICGGEVFSEAGKLLNDLDLKSPTSYRLVYGLLSIMTSAMIKRLGHIKFALLNDLHGLDMVSDLHCHNLLMDLKQKDKKSSDDVKLYHRSIEKGLSDLETRVTKSCLVQSCEMDFNTFVKRLEASMTRTRVVREEGKMTFLVNVINLKFGFPSSEEACRGEVGIAMCVNFFLLLTSYQYIFF